MFYYQLLFQSIVFPSSALFFRLCGYWGTGGLGGVLGRLDLAFRGSPNSKFHAFMLYFLSWGISFYALCMFTAVMGVGILSFHPMMFFPSVVLVLVLRYGSGARVFGFVFVCVFSFSWRLCLVVLFPVGWIAGMGWDGGGGRCDDSCRCRCRVWSWGVWLGS